MAKLKRFVCPECYHDFTVETVVYDCDVDASASSGTFGGGAGTDSECKGCPQLSVGQFSIAAFPLSPDRRKEIKRAKKIPVPTNCPRRNRPSRGTDIYCPNCSKVLPEDINRAPKTKTLSFPIVGTPASGKSNFMVALVNVINDSFVGDFPLGFEFADDNSRRKFDAFKKHIYAGIGNKGRGANKTKETDEGKERPIISTKIDLLSDKILQIAGLIPPRVNVTLFDAAGEHFNTEEQLEKSAAFLGLSNGIIFMVDPFHFQVVTDTLGISGGELDNTRQQAPVNLLERVIAKIRESRNIKTGKIGIPIAVVIPKADALIPKIIDQSNAINHGSEHLLKGSLQVGDIDNVSQIAESLLKQWGVKDLIARVERNFKHYRYFAVSAFKDADFDGRIDDIITKRVEDPFLYLLWQNGIFKGTK